MATIDTLRYYKQLTASGVSNEQAHVYASHRCCNWSLKQILRSFWMP